MQYSSWGIQTMVMEWINDKTANIEVNETLAFNNPFSNVLDQRNKT